MQEAPVIGTGDIQYTVNNTSTTFSPGGKFDISLFLATTNGANPTTTDTGWNAEAVNATDWTLPMGASENFPLTWQQYTGLSYTQAFPSIPIKVNGYFLNYTFNSDTGDVAFPANPLTPSTSLGGFFVTGSLDSTFLVAGPTDGTTSFAPGNVVTYSAATADVPEPTSVGLVAIAVCGFAMRRRRKIA